MNAYAFSDALPCYCKRTGQLGPFSGEVSVCGGGTIFTVSWETGGMCYAGKYPWGGVRLEIEGNDIDGVNGTYDLLGPPCALSTPGGLFGTTPYEIGWRVELPDPIPYSGGFATHITHVELVVASQSTLGVHFLGPFGGNLRVEGHRYNNAPIKDCLSWSGDQTFDDFDSSSTFKGGTITATALEFPPA